MSKFKLLVLVLAVTVSACSGIQVTRVQELSETADAPYDNVLVIALVISFPAMGNLRENANNPF